MKALVLLLFFCLCSVADQQSSISLGSTLSASDKTPWTSASATFALGFLPQKNDSYILAIWYYKLSPITVVWSPRSGGSLADFALGKQATVTLSNAGDLVLSDGATTFWSTKTASTGVTGASLTDSGNFVLFNSLRIIWQSFNFPTHTLLPNQQLRSGALANGNFRLQILNNKLVLNYTLAAVPADESFTDLYWQSEVINFQPYLSLGSSGRLAAHDDLGNDSAIAYTYDYPSANITRRLSLDSDGNARIYSLDLSSNSWVVAWQAVGEECSINERCGLNAICVYIPEPTCICAPGFLMQNGSCIAEIPIGCASNVSSDKTKLIPLYHTDFRFNDLQQESTSMETCKSLCIVDCKCLAAVYSIAGDQRCYLKSKLANGQQLTSTHFVSFLKVIANATLDERYQLPQNMTSHVTISPSIIINSTKEISIEVLRRKTSILLGPLSAALAVAVVEFCCLVLGACVIWKMRSQKRTVSETEWISSMPMRFSYEQLKIATQNFKEKIGAGGFGQVYRGVLADNTVAAIKKLELANHGEQQFKAEVTTMGKIHHINLVRLLGYCSEGPHRLLVHQYITNGSLDKFLFSKNWDQTCNWNIRFGIAVGIARGITYLHEECQECILHLDIKPQNVLLDENFQPKICDFGMAKLISREMVASMSAIRGTRGYLAPEWMSHHPITAKADVYSYGMLLLEILSGRPNCLTTSSLMKTNQWYFPEWAAEKLEDGDLEAMADPRLGTEIDWDQFVKAVKVSFWCIQLDPASRFEMSKVVQMLEGSLEVHSPPPAA